MIQYNEAGEPVLMGIVSVGAGCGLSEFPGVYMRTSTFESWMDKETGLEYTKTRSVISEFGNGLSTGAIVGISIAAIILAALVVVIAIAITKKRRWRSKRKASVSLDGPTGATVPSTLDTGMHEWNTTTAAARQRQSRLPVTPPYSAMDPRYFAQVPLQQPPVSPSISYGMMQPSSPSVSQQSQQQGPNFSPGAAVIDYSQAGLPTNNYVYRGETEESALSPSLGNDEKKGHGG